MIDLFEFSKIIGKIFDPIPMIILGLILASYFFITHSKRKGYFLAFVSISSGILIKVLKEIIMKPRPLEMLIEETGYTFPSGHATISIALFGSIAYLISKGKSKEVKILSWLIVIICVAIISFTRLYLQVHDIYDVLGGFLLGSIILITGIFLSRKL